MRILASLFILTAAVIQLLLGGLLIFSAVEARDDARAEAGDLSSVSGDLVSEEELASMRAHGEKQAGSTGKAANYLGMAAMALGLFQLVAGVLALLRRALIFVIAVAVASLACLMGMLLLEGGGNTAVMTLCLLATGLVLVGLELRSRRAASDKASAA